MSLTTAGKASSTPNPKSTTTTQSSFIIRPARFTDAYRQGWIAGQAYDNSPLIMALNPYRHQYRDDYIRGFQQRALKRMFDPRHTSIVVAEASNPSLPIAYAHFIRLGDDEGAKKQIASRNGTLLWILSWIFEVYCIVFNFIKGGDKSSDPQRAKDFNAVSWSDVENHFKSVPGSENRWQVQSCVVLNEFQRKGLGKMMMLEVLKKGESEGVGVGLQASEKGEKLYATLGFKLLSRFTPLPWLDEGEVGGAMYWTPPSMRGSNDGK